MVYFRSCFGLNQTLRVLGKRNNKTTGYVVQLRFIICINVIDISLLYLIKQFFGCGVISSINTQRV
jgi:hypothetical protein